MHEYMAAAPLDGDGDGDSNGDVDTVQNNTLCLTGTMARRGQTNPSTVLV